jgi:hypothetical protein
MNPGAEYRLTRLLTGIRYEDDQARMIRLPAGTYITVAGFIAGSLFIQIVADGLVCEVLQDDLREAATALALDDHSAVAS